MANICAAARRAPEPACVARGAAPARPPRRPGARGHGSRRAGPGPRARARGRGGLAPRWASSPPATRRARARARGPLVSGIDAQELAEPEPGGAEAATAVLLQGEVVHLRRARPDGVPGRTDRRPRGARVQRGHRLLGPLLDSGPELREALLALARQLLHRNELLLHADQVRADVAAELHQIGLLRRDRLLHGGEQFQHGVNLRGPVGIRPGGVGLQRRDLELDLPDITLEGAAGREPQAEDERYMARQRSPAYGCRNASPPERMSNSSRRFCAHAVSSWPCAIGRSSPYDTVSMRPASMPWLTTYCFAEVARRFPSARLYSSDPRSSQCPEIRIRRLGFACRIEIF